MTINSYSKYPSGTWSFFYQLFWYEFGFRGAFTASILLPTYAFVVAQDLGVTSPAEVVVQLIGPDGICDPGPDGIWDPLLTPTLLPNYFILEPKRVEDTCRPLKRVFEEGTLSIQKSSDPSFCYLCSDDPVGRKGNNGKQQLA